MMEWSELSAVKRIAVFPARHPYPMRALLYIFMTMATEVSWESMFKVAGSMGYILLTDEEDLGGGMSQIHKGWAVPQ